MDVNVCGWIEECPGGGGGGGELLWNASRIMWKTDED